MRPSGSNATAFTARIMEAQHLLGDVARAATSGSPTCRSCRTPPRLPSAETASARTGPPWPRSCACGRRGKRAAASSEQQARCRSGVMPAPSRARGCARACRSSRSAARNACTAGRSRRGFDDQEIVVLRRDRQEAEPVHPRHRLDRDAPVGAALRDRRGDGVVRLRLVGVAGRPLAVEQRVDQHARAGAGVAVDHQRDRHRRARRRAPPSRCGPRSACRRRGTGCPACAASPARAQARAATRCTLYSPVSGSIRCTGAMSHSPRRDRRRRRPGCRPRARARRSRAR